MCDHPARGCELDQGGGRRPGLRRPAARMARGATPATTSLGSTSTSRVTRLARRASPSSRTSPSDGARGGARHRAVPSDAATRDAAGFDVCVITVPTPLRDGRARPELRRAGRRRDSAVHLSRAPRSCSSRRRTRAPPRSCSLPILEDGTWPQGRRGLPSRLQPRAHRPRQPDLDTCVNTPKVVVRDRRGVARARSRRFYARFVDQVVPVSSTQDRRADQAAGEHLPARQHRARQRDRDRSPRARRRHLGGDRRGATQAVRLHALHAGPGRRWSLPADRPVLPVVAGPPDLAHDFRFVGWPTTSTTTCPTTSCGASNRV